MRAPTYKNLSVKKARNGQGIFANVYFRPEQIMCCIEGSRKHYTTLLRKEGTFLDNCFRISENYYLSPEGYIGAYLNHACEPNARIVKEGGKLYVRAVSHIPANTEILIDYSTITASDDIWTMRCNCGTVTCRQVIRNFSRLPKTLQKKYIALHIVPSYITHL